MRPNLTVEECQDGIAMYETAEFHTTPSHLLEKGVCLCDACGHMCSVDDKVCLACDNEIVIFKEATHGRTLPG